MSSPANGGPEVPVEKKKSLLSRMKTILKKNDGSKRLSFSSRGPTAPSASTPQPTTLVAAPAVTRKTEPVPEPVKLTDGPQPRKLIRSEIDTERARKLAERYRITIEPYQWSSTKMDKEVYRVEKPIRMRVHRQCHKCNTTFGGNKTCVACEHVRCKSCPRFPHAKKAEKKGKENIVPAPTAQEIEVDKYWNLIEELPLTKPNPNSNRPPLVRKKPMQRVRRTCCGCAIVFTANSKVCSGCSHSRCVDCPRDPAKKKFFPDGYPGDAFSSDITKPIRYACHTCGKAFPPTPHPSSTTAQELGEDALKQKCVRCGHERCNTCPRNVPRKVDPEPDLELVKRVEAKLAALNINKRAA